ncbi:MAG: hypothetical protein P8L44_06185, partial [Opitutales bacterium]|nr:hypothetical protein [Opitutales bacterium]
SCTSGAYLCIKWSRNWMTTDQAIPGNPGVGWLDGLLPEEISMDELLGVHASHPRNPLFSDACFKAGYIDT